MYCRDAEGRIIPDTFIYNPELERFTPGLASTMSSLWESTTGESGSRVIKTDSTKTAWVDFPKWDDLDGEIYGAEKWKVYDDSHKDSKYLVYKDTNPSDGRENYNVISTDKQDLSERYILETLSIMKGDLFRTCHNVRIKQFECEMTPMIKDTIIHAYKKTKMYGKKMPFVPCFNAFGEELPYEFDIRGLENVKVVIVDPKIYGNYYMSLKGIVV